MTALTPGCDPDMSVSGAPFGAVPGALRLRSGLVLLVPVALAVLVTVTDRVPAPVTVPVLVVGALCALALVARGIRLAQRLGQATATAAARAVHRGSPVPTTAP